MRYCLVSENPRLNPFKKLVFFYCKRDLVDWITSHSFCLSHKVLRSISLHRVVSSRYFGPVVVGPRICSLYDYSVKHKLL